MKHLNRNEMKDLKGGKLDQGGTCTMDCTCAEYILRLTCPQAPCCQDGGSMTCYGQTHDCNWYCMHY